jgi:hypothetical protein
MTTFFITHFSKILLKRTSTNFNEMVGGFWIKQKYGQTIVQGQYKCNKKILWIATFPKNVSRVLILHQFAMKYNLKGVWDATGKVVTNYMKNLELTEGSDNQFTTALDCSLTLWQCLWLKTRPWLELKKKLDACILQKTFFTVTGCKFGYVTEVTEEWMQYSVYRPDQCTLYGAYWWDP